MFTIVSAIWQIKLTGKGVSVINVGDDLYLDYSLNELLLERIQVNKQ
jgi:hypothetical protein